MSGERSAETEERTIRLASIVAIDVAGFSSMSERDQRRAAENIERLRARIEAVAARHGGRIFNTAGDGFMLEFASAGAALSAINELLDKRPKKEPKVRIGAHVGDVVVTVNNDLLGHGVNVAARLQSLAAPNSALVSGEFRSMARNSPQAAFESKGRQPLENIDQKVLTYAIISQKQRMRRAFAQGATALGAMSVAALLVVYAGPFVLREIDQQDFFARSSEGEAAAEAPPVAMETVAAATIPAPAPTPAPAPIKRQPGEVFRDCPTCPELVVAPAGVFQTSGSAGAAVETTIPSIAVGIYETTFAEWDGCLAAGGCMGFSPSDNGWGRGRRPVVGVSWDDAQAYVQQLARQTGRTYRLPTAAEWEYLARGGAASRYAFGDAIAQGQAAFGGTRTDPVGSYAANAFGLYDVHGNAGEWVEDCEAPVAQGQSCAKRVIRGGDFAARPSALRFEARYALAPDRRAPGTGFRVVRELE